MTEPEASTKLAPWLLIPVVAAVAFGLGRCVAGDGGGEAAQTADLNEGAEEAAEEWTCSMHPQIRQPEFGPCPICAMDLIPLSAVDSNTSPTQVELSPRAAMLARIETVEVERLSSPELDLRLLGRVEVDEGRVRNVSAWIGGRVDGLKVRETGTVVRRGQSIATLYSPEVYAAHQDLLTAQRQLDRLSGASELAQSSAKSALESARERLRLLGVPDAELDAMAEAEKPRKSVAIRAQEGGTVMERLVTQGQYVETGAILYRVADLSKLWVQLDAYEADLPMLLEGQSVELEVEALPGRSFQGEIAFIDPLVDPRRRVAKVRVEVDNASGELRPGMFVEALVRGELGREGEGGEPSTIQRPLVVPASAPLFTGRRSLVYVEVASVSGAPTYEARVVELGPRMGDRYPVVAGLSAGERVVTHGAFVLDADLQIRGGDSMMVQPDAREQAALDRRVVLDEALRPVLGEVLRAYLELQVTLADDDWKAAQAAGARLAKASEAMTAKAGVDGTDEGVGEAWSALGPGLGRRATEAAESAAIESARGAFLQLSGDVKVLLAVFGNPLDEPVRLAYCPMANANEGAEWVQAGEVVDNSYFGASMLSCGEIRSVVEPGQYLLSADGPSQG